MQIVEGITVKVRYKVNEILKEKFIINFLRDISIVSLFRVVSILIQTITMALVARYFTVAEYGKVTMVNTTAQYLLIPMIAGINLSIIKYLNLENKNENRKIIGTGFTCNIVLSVFFISIYIIFQKYLGSITKLSRIDYWLCLVLAVTLNLSMYTDAILRAKKKFFIIGLSKLISMLVLFFLTSYLLIIKNYSYSSIFVIALIVSQIIFLMISFTSLEEKGFKYSSKIMKKLYSYGLVNMVNWVLTTVLSSIDIFIVRYFCTDYEVGLYAVYMIIIRNFFYVVFHEIFCVVFQPTIVHLDKDKIYHKLLKITPIIFVGCTIATLLLSIFTLLLFGPNYRINWIYIFTVSINIALHAVFWIIHTIFSMDGKKGAFMCLLSMGLPLPYLIFQMVFLTKKWGILGAMISNVITQIILICMICLLNKVRKRLITVRQNIEL